MADTSGSAFSQGSAAREVRSSFKGHGPSPPGSRTLSSGPRSATNNTRRRRTRCEDLRLGEALRGGSDDPARNGWSSTPTAPRRGSPARSLKFPWPSTSTYFTTSTIFSTSTQFATNFSTVTTFSTSTIFSVGTSTSFSTSTWTIRSTGTSTSFSIGSWTSTNFSTGTSTIFSTAASFTTGTPTQSINGTTTNCVMRLMTMCVVEETP
mmetsp:Transcript_45608/g.141436  ORF Transcript_45608/g.141436 Transcript_45608/m.141436 type:complete len:208 (-) Transcript_45608:206-829(-)